MKTMRYVVLEAESGKGWAVVMLFDNLKDRYVVAADHPNGTAHDESGTRARAALDFERHLNRLGGSDGRLST